MIRSIIVFPKHKIVATLLRQFSWSHIGAIQRERIESSEAFKRYKKLGGLEKLKKVQLVQILHKLPITEKPIILNFMV